MLSNLFCSLANKYCSINNWYHVLAKSMFDHYDVKFIPSTHGNIFLRLHKNNNDGLFGTQLFGTQQYIGGIDLVIDRTTHRDQSEISHFMVNDRYFALSMGEMYGKSVDDLEAGKIAKNLHLFAEKISKVEDCNSIRMDVHPNLKRFSNYSQPYGFELNGNKANDGSCWIQSTKQLCGVHK